MKNIFKNNHNHTSIYAYTLMKKTKFTTHMRYFPHNTIIEKGKKSDKGYEKYLHGSCPIYNRNNLTRMVVKLYSFILFIY
jgi:hypothetical protein